MPRKILTIAGTRPELIRLSVIIKKLDERCDQYFLWTGQNYDRLLGEIFFKCLSIREPEYRRANDKPFSGLADQLASSLTMIEGAILEAEPDAALILGDTNSALASAIMCERLDVPVYHMEAGNRCFDDRVPEEKNRRVIDAICTYNLPYTPGSRQNLIDEGRPREKIFVCGNPIYEVINNYGDGIEKSEILSKLNFKSRSYFLATFHRQENVDFRDRLKNIIIGLRKVAERFQTKIICSMHPRTREKMQIFEIKTGPDIIIHEPFDFLDFIKLERNATAVLTDSGTVQEECCLFHVPTVTVRDSTERPETVTCGSNLISGLQPDQIVECMKEMLRRPRSWSMPDGYQYPNVSERVLEYIGV